MKFITYNVRGFGGWEKRKDVLILVKFRPWILFIQETKLATIDEFFMLIFGGIRILYFFIGLIWNTRSLENAIITNGRFVKSGCIFFVSNVYTPCYSSCKQ